MKRTRYNGKRGRLRVGVTGFGPFPGVPFNASERLIADVADMRIGGVPAPLVAVAALPTDWRRAVTELHRFAEAFRPDVLVHFGVSARARGFVIETRAYNQTSPRADCSGAHAPGRCVRTNAAAALTANLPTAHLVQRLRAEGITATLSADPGRYLCNAVLFESLIMCATHGTRLAGFVHIPALPAPETGLGLRNGFGWPQLRRGAMLILETVARTA